MLAVSGRVISFQHSVWSDYSTSFSVAYVEVVKDDKQKSNT